MSHADYDIVGIGIGPFNLGLAALGSSIPGLRMRFFERRPAFDWHPGMLIDGTMLQVSFLADLVTMADPCHPLSFLSYLKQAGRLYQFAIRDRSFMSRKEYNCYCQWAVSRLDCLQFHTEVTQVCYDAELGCYRVETRDTSSAERQEILARNVVIGVGTVPRMPACVPRERTPRVFHSADYLSRKQSALASRSVALVGSGQSAAEIFHDLVQSKSPHTVVTWLTRAERFFAMDDSKLSLEMVSPDYVDHFFELPQAVKAGVLGRQDTLYKGINAELINRIYDLLYDRTTGQTSGKSTGRATGQPDSHSDGQPDERANGTMPGDVFLATSCELERVDIGDHELVLGFRQCELDQTFEHRADTLILATGYEYRIPAFLEPLRDHIEWDEQGRLVVNRNYSVACKPGGLFVQNAEMHTHGFTTPDLSMGPYRNATILNTILGREVFPLETRTAFQDFGLPRLPQAHPGIQPQNQPDIQRGGGAFRHSATSYRPGATARTQDLRRRHQEDDL